MYTRCPNCETYFKISAEQLKKAGGKVRCGQCTKVFNSLGNLLEELPVALSDRGKVKPAAPAVAKPAVTPPKPTAAAPTAPPKPQPAPVARAAAPAPTPVAAPPPKPAPAPPKAPPPPKPEPAPPLFENKLSEDTILFDGGAEQPLQFSNEINDTLNLNSDDKIENVQAGPFSSVRDLVPYPAEENAPDSYGDGDGISNLVWGGGVAVLLLLFILQYSYYMRDDLARYPELRPWIQKLCDIAQCDLPLQQNIDLIKLTNRDITSHPRVKGALLINAIIVNTATFSQPFPAMQITLSDINGTVIAKRRFQPVEYLDADMNLRRGMPPNSPVQIGLEIADPGKDAVNFEFNFFHPAP